MTNDEVVNHPAVQKTITFLKDAFQKHPHYSFNDWTIMYDHSVNVMRKSLELAEDHDVDKIVLAITSLLHDIGKTLDRDEKTLREKHEELGLEVSEAFLNSLTELSDSQRNQIKELFRKDHPDLIKKIMKDADYLDFYQNEYLHDAFKKWVDQNHLPEQIDRKIIRFEKMDEKAKKLARPYMEKLKKKWRIS